MTTISLSSVFHSFFCICKPSVTTSVWEKGVCVTLTSDEEKQMATDQNSKRKKLKMTKIITFACFFPLLILVFFVVFQTTLTEVQFGPMKLIKDPLQVSWNNPERLNDRCSCVFECSGEKENSPVKHILLWNLLIMEGLTVYLRVKLGVNINIWSCVSRISIAKPHLCLLAVKTILKFLNHSALCWEIN